MKWTKYCKIRSHYWMLEEKRGLFEFSLGVCSMESARCSLLLGCLVSDERRAPPKVCYFERFCHTHYDLELHQMDVKMAFLNGDLYENIYMAKPKRLCHGRQ